VTTSSRFAALRRPRQIVLAVLLSYIALTLGANLALLAMPLVARQRADAPAEASFASVKHLRQLSDSVWASAQPDSDDYERLAVHGFTLVVDLRTGATDDPNLADPEHLRSLGLRYERIPVPDGHVPSPHDVARLVQLVDGAGGSVLVHCGGGVGRSASMQASYLAAAGEAPSWRDIAQVGPMTLHQAWFVATASVERPAPDNVVVRRLSEAFDAPRRIFSRLRKG
jgi:uncharacterized protein (TIGR01244 family)